MKIPVSSADLTDTNIQAVVNVIHSGHLARGPQTREFERLVADYIGIERARLGNRKRAFARQRSLFDFEVWVEYN
jgi:dTDP-4-amino-4,6-dideoxygalactose transaminase